MTITACTSDPAIVAPSSTTPLSTLRPKAPMGVSAAELASRTAVESYTAMWMTMADVAETADWRSPRLSQHATGTALSTISRGIYLDHTNGWVSRGRPALSPSVAGVEPTDKPTRVRITDCGDSTSWLKYDATTGQLVDDDPGGRRAITAVVDKQDNGAWMVSDFAVQELGSC
ncbi:hypothetical protein [Actinophytocola oryzae]|uniref:hypothetical protein n=1 Tax=Actinophytocola oryzae TaxID=502181 RepID=UPI001FB95FD6|nr:hypothetical protein [Actinophytocola oryzae]